MKNKFALLAVASLLLLALSFDGCDPKDDLLSIAGKVYNGTTPLPGVLIQIQDQTTTTDKDGYFKISRLKEEKPYVLNASLIKYGFVSKVYNDTSTNVRINMAKALVDEIDLNTVNGDSIVISQLNPDVSVPLSAGSSTPANPFSAIPFVYDSAGRLVDFEMPAALQTTYDAIQNFRPPVLGARVVLPKKGLLVKEENSKIEVSLQTIDLYSPDGMPGNYSVLLKNRQIGFMRTYGAANVDIFQNGETVQLKDGYEAKIIIPVDTLSILTKEKLVDRLPFLVYQRESGLWVQEGEAVLNSSRTAYEARTKHFSTFNMDMVFGASASCYKICNEVSVTTFPAQQIEISVPSKSKLLSVGAPCASAGNCTTIGAGTGAAHAIINLEPYTPVGVKLYNSGTLLTTKVFVTGGSSSSQACDFNACNGPVLLTNGVDQLYVNSARTGMCHAFLASPQKKLDDVTAPYTVKIAWLYDNDFAVDSATPLTFDVQVSTTENFAATVINLTNFNPPGTEDIINSYEFTGAAINSSYYFRVRPTGAADTDWSNVTCITFDAMGNTTAPCVSAVVPPHTCM